MNLLMLKNRLVDRLSASPEKEATETLELIKGQELLEQIQTIYKRHPSLRNVEISMIFPK
ncbi:hypothetical protein P4J10_14430 [Bacillus cereus]|uniref:hypothetical protein n=1 Tax=Bacillus thuringiensis TaxID=1428 RepID=UPI000B448C55|nr:hypothetical protein [Bacillus thuringiensis]MEB9467868.1 hypothetical protein [Bacillus cereus]OUA16747.1 hypothetical protein BK776_30880 [Bacillus thuringiensis serovar aizawai]